MTNQIPTLLYYNISICISAFKQLHKISNNKYYYVVKQVHKPTQLFFIKILVHHAKKPTQNSHTILVE
jgi:hypothetical protein